jgi:hypothetical protein
MLWKDEKTINAAKSRDKTWNRRKLNALGLSSHKMGTRKDTTYDLVTTNLDQGETGMVKRTKYGKNVIGFRQIDWLKGDEEVEWVVLTESDYTTQLLAGISHMKQVPKKVIRTGDQVFLDPDVFYNLVKLQETSNDTKLVLSFDRGTLNRRDHSLKILVQNPKNYDRSRPGSAGHGDEDRWTHRERRGTLDFGKKGV